MYRRVLLALALCVAWALVSFVLRIMGGTATVIDGLSMVLGFAINILSIVAYVEAPFLNIISGLSQFALWVQIVFVNGNYAAMTYLVYSIYCAYMIARTFYRWLALYKEQQS